jgi:hypothetical protein
MKELETGRRPTAAAALLCAAALAAGCAQPDLTVPTADEAAAYYTIAAEHSVDVTGNVAELVVEQSADQLRRGGTLWAKVGPYVYLFTEGTRDLFEDFPGLAAVRVVTQAPDGTEVARATLPRDALNGLTWQRALNLAGHARLEGTERPRRLEELIDWGEERTEHRYEEGYLR